MPVTHHIVCPVCDSRQIGPVLNAIDHTVSGETFSIWECAECSFRFTQDAPDAASIQPYYQSEDYISHSDTSKGLVNQAYHLVRNYTLKQKRRLVVSASGKEKGVLLDIGAGTGAFLGEMKAAGWKVSGLEPDAGARKRANEKYAIELEEPRRLFSLEESRFDAITLWHVLEHVHQLNAYMEQFTKLLAPGGVLILALPNYTSKDAGHYGGSWAAYDVPRHLYHFSPRSVRKLLERHGMILYSMHPMWFDSFYISMLSEQYKFGRPNHFSALLNGLSSNKKALSRTESASSIIYIAGLPQPPGEIIAG